MLLQNWFLLIVLSGLSSSETTEEHTRKHQPYMALAMVEKNKSQATVAAQKARFVKNVNKPQI